MGCFARSATAPDREPQKQSEHGANGAAYGLLRGEADHRNSRRSTKRVAVVFVPLSLSNSRLRSARRRSS